VSNKLTSWLGVILTAVALVVAAAVAHAQVASKVENNTYRIEELERQNRALLYNTARICERLGIPDCR
jgi:hypothetical protein